MDKKLFALLLMVYVAFLIGCTGGTNNSIQVASDFRTGTSALQMSFDSSATSANMFESESGSIVVDIRNAGAYSLTSGLLTLSTDDSVLYFGSKQQYDDGVLQQQNTKKLVTSSNRPFFGKSPFSPNGDELVYSFPVYALQLPFGTQQRSAKVVAVACFPYETYQSDNVCIVVNQDSQRANSGTASSSQLRQACTPKDLSLKSGGGPINVNTVQVRFDPSSSSGEIMPTLYFTLSASGSAFSSTKFFAPGSQQNFCDSRASTSSTDANVIFFKATLSDHPLTCVADSAGYLDTYRVQLYDNAARISCSAPSFFVNSGDVIGNYYAPLAVNLSYGVVTSTTQTILVKSAKTQGN